MSESVSNLPSHINIGKEILYEYCTPQEFKLP